MSEGDKRDTARELAVRCAREAYARRGGDIVVYDLRGLTDIADYFVIASGDSRRQLQAMANGIEEAAKETGERPLGMEGMATANWVLLDFADCVVHLFMKDVRDYYDLDMLWGDAPKVDWEEQ